MDSMKNNNGYEINALTMLITPMSYGNKLYSRIVQLDGEFHSPYKPTAIIKQNCLSNCSNYEGRISGSKFYLGRIHKVPIMINFENQMFYFPTTSPDHPSCIWINPVHIEDHIAYDKKSTLVTFRNKLTMNIPVSYHIFNNQMKKTSLLQNKMAQKNRDNEGRLRLHYPSNFRTYEYI